MEPLLIQLALQAGRPLMNVVEQFYLQTNRHKRFPNLVQFKYSQLESDLKDKFVQQCRGLILDEADNWKVIARPLDKFFNYGEGSAATIDWNNAKVYEKLDGSLCIMYYYDGWRVATSGSCDASGNVGLSSRTFEELFWQVFMDKGFQTPTELCRNYTYMFELCTPLNRVVVDYGKSDLRLIGIRQRVTGQEVDISNSKQFDPVQKFDLRSMEDLMLTLDEMEPLKQEGYVVVDSNYNRIKVKHPGYVALHHMKSHFSVRYMVDLVRRAELAEVIAYFPEWSDILFSVKDSFDKLVDEIDRTYDLYKDIVEQKAFAQAVIKCRYSGVLFCLRNGKATSTRAFLKDMHIDTLIHLMGVKDSMEKLIQSSNLLKVAS